MNSADKFIEEKEMKYFEGLCEVLGDKDKFFKTKINEYHLAMLDKLISLPIDKVFPGLDLYRIFLLHPDAV